MQHILTHFPNITEKQRNQFALLDALYRDWNSKINVISRKDIDNLYSHHVLHSLAIAETVSFKPGTKILDFGTGGGFPGIPLTIMFPDCQFTLIDGTRKKILVCNEVIKALGINNATAIQRRGEDEKGKYDFVVSRAVMPLPDLVKIIRKNIDQKNQRNAYPNGAIVLKGGALDAEIKPFKNIVEKIEIATWFHDDWFKEKYVIYLPL